MIMTTGMTVRIHCSNDHDDNGDKQQLNLRQKYDDSLKYKNKAHV